MTGPDTLSPMLRLVMLRDAEEARMCEAMDALALYPVGADGNTPKGHRDETWRAWRAQAKEAYAAMQVHNRAIGAGYWKEYAAWRETQRAIRKGGDRGQE